MLTDINKYKDDKILTVLLHIGSCESFFCIRIESQIESAIRFDFESNFRIKSAVYTTQAVTPSNELQGAPCRRTVWACMLTTSVVNVCVVLMCYCVQSVFILYLSRTRVMHATEYLLFISIQS